MPDSSQEDASSGYIPKFTPEEVERRFLYLMKECIFYLADTMRRHPTWELDIDPVVMMNVAQSAMDDIWRYKVFHLGEPDKFSDGVKRVAYFTKWIMKLRPIYHKRHLRSAGFIENFDKSDDTLFINERFCLYFASFSLAEKDEDIIVFHPNFSFNLLYDMHFRDMNEAAYLNIFQTVRDLADSKKLIEISKV